MKRLLVTLAAANLMTLASTVHGQTVSGMDLSWNDCIGLPGAAANMDYACDGSRNGNPFHLVVTTILPATIHHFVGVQINMRVRTQSLQLLPDWWRLGVGECREGGLTFPASLSGIGTGSTGACRNPWLGANTGGGYAWYSENAGDYPPAPTLMPGFGVLKMAFARDTETTLEQFQRSVMGVLDLDPGPAVLDPPCAGCETPACIVLHTVELFQTVGSPGGDIIVLSSPAERLFVTWQGGAIGRNGCPLEVPVKRATWGAVKAIYR